MLYEEILTWWQQKKVTSKADLAFEMNGNNVAFIYHSAKIENESISYHDTREIFDHDGVTSYTGDIRSLFEIRNSVSAYKKLLDSFDEKALLTSTLICEFQEILTQGTYDTQRYQKGERPGTYKKNDYVTGRNEVGALPADVDEEMNELILELQDASPKHILTAAAYFHAKFENIHPFADGNGRTGRLLMNYILLMANHPPIIIHEEDKRTYYDALEAFDTRLELSPLISFLKEQTVKTWKTRFDRQQKPPS